MRYAVRRLHTGSWLEEYLTAENKEDDDAIKDFNQDTFRRSLVRMFKSNVGSSTP